MLAFVLAGALAGCGGGGGASGEDAGSGTDSTVGTGGRGTGGAGVGGAAVPGTGGVTTGMGGAVAGTGGEGTGPGGAGGAVAGTGGTVAGTGGAVAGTGGAATGTGGASTGTGGASTGTGGAIAGTGGAVIDAGDSDGGADSDGPDAGGAGTGGAGTGGAGTGGAGTGGAGTGGAVVDAGVSADAGGAGMGGGTLDAGTGAGGGGGTGATLPGSAALTVPFVTGAGSTSTNFQISFGGNVDLSAAGATVTFRLCVASSSAASTTIAFSLQNGSATSFSGNFGPQMPLSGIATCPTMQDIAFTVAGEALVANAVQTINVTIASPSITTAVSSPTVVYVDSIQVTGNVVGPYDFTFNTQPLIINPFATNVAGSTVTFVGSGGNGAGGAPGVVDLVVPFTAASQSTFFNLVLAGNVDLSAGGLMVNYSLCVASSTASPSSYTFQPSVTNNSGSGNYAGSKALTTLSTCPALTTVSIPLAGGNLTATSVNNLGIQLGSTGTGPFGTATLEVDSITVTPGNPVGPYDFADNAEAFVVNTFQPVTGSAVTWQAAP